MLIGNLGADPEVRSTNNGSQLADLAEKYMKKGDRIYVEGRIEYRTWEDREKQTRYVTEIIAREVLLLSSRGGGGGGGAGGGGEGSGEFARAKATAKVAPEAGGKTESLDAFPEALDEEDDDLPF